MMSENERKKVDCTAELDATKAALTKLFGKIGYIKEGEEVDKVYFVTPVKEKAFETRLGFTIKRRVI